MIDAEIESITSILNETEFKDLGLDVFNQEEDSIISEVARVFKLSLIPNCNKKFVLIDAAKDITIELKCLPAIDIIVAIPKAYPSSVGPLFFVDAPFYEPFKKFPYEQLNQKWQENSMVIYEVIIYIQDELLNAFFEESGFGQEMLNAEGQV